MALIPLEKAIAKARANQSKNEKYSTTSLMSPNDARAQQEIGMQQRRTAFENYKAARAAMQQQAQRQVTQGYERRADAMGTVARGYGQSNMPTAAKKTAYENYTYALKQKELRQKQMSGKPLTPAEQKILNTTVYRDPAQAANAENNKYQNQAVQNVESEEQITKHQFDHTPEMVKQYGSYENYKRGLYDNEYVGVLKEREDELGGQIKELEQQIRTRHAEAETATEEGVRRENERKELIKQGKLEGISDMEARLAQLQQEQMQLQSERAMKRSHMAIDPLDDETKALLREYNAGGMYTRDYSKQNGGSGLSKMEARADLRAKGYSEDEIKSLAEYEQRLQDYENAMTQAEQSYQFGQEHPYISTAASALMAPAKALGNIESLRGVLPKGFGGYQNADMPTNIYSPLYNASRVSGSIRSGVMQDMGTVGQFLYQAGTSALDSAVNMAASIGLVGAAGLGTGAAAQGAVANTMNFVMGSQVAADSVYEGIQNGKSNVDALIDGIVEGAIEGITEKYSVGDIIETMLSGKAAWRKVVRAFASEGAEEIASNWLNRIYDVTAKRGRGEVEAAYRDYLAKGMSERDAMAAMVKDFAEEDGLSFLAGGLSGWAMSGTYAALGKGASEANIQWTAAQAIQRGEVQDVIDLGLAQGKGAAFDRAAALQGDLMRGGEPTQKDVAGVLREYVREQQDAAEDAQSGDQTQENQTYQNFKNAMQSVEQSQTEYEQAQRQQNQQSQGVDLYDEDGSLLDVGEGWAEIDPEQYAGQQTAQAEAEMDKAAAAADNAYLERQVQKNGYDDLTAAYFVNGNTTDLSLEEYAAKFQKAYKRGQMGVSKEWTVGAAVGMNRDVATAAWEAGKKAAQQSGAATEKYSINDTRNLSQKEQFKEYRAGRFKAKDEFAFGAAPESVQKIGLTGEIVMSQTDYKKAKTAKHNVPQRVFNNLKSIMDSAVLSFEKGDEVGVLTSEIDADGKPLLLAFRKNVNLDGETVTRMKSAYGLDTPSAWVQNQIKDGKTLRILDNKKADNFLNSVGYKAERTGNYQLGDTVSEIQKKVKGGNEHGKNVSAEGQERNDGARAGEQAQRVEQAAGGRSESARRGRERADQARNLSGTWPQVTNAELLSEGGTQSTVAVMPAAEIRKNADAKKAAEFFRTAGIKRYQFVVGQLETTVDGRTFRADGVTLADGTVLVRLDSEEYTATQLAKHEGYHIIAQRNAEMAQRIRKRLVDEGKISKAQIDSYIDAYNSIYGDNTDAYVEEIVADAYAGINRTAYGTNNIRAEVTMEAGQWTKKSGSARAPPELQFSASAEQISEQDRENLNKVLEMMDAEGDGIFRDAVLLRNPKMLQKLVAERGKTESAAFTRWFGNSKAVNRNGEPMLVFHGAGARFTTFDAGGKPIWLTANIQYAEKYSTANRAAEKLLPSSSIYAGNVDRVIPAYIRVENPANVGDTDGGFDGNYMDLAKRIGARPSELRKAWEEAGRPEMLWQAVNSKQMSELLKRHGYDGIQAIENGVATWAVLEPTQIKSAVANNGVFSLKSADIRYALAQQRFRDALPERAAEYVARTENTLVRRLADNLSVPETAKRETLRPIADEIIYDVLRGGEMDSAKLNRLFEQAWEAGREADTEYYEQYKDVREKIRTQKLFISAKDRADIADFNLFRKQTMGTLRLSSDGLPVDTFYQEMRDMAPELFPASITAPSDQLLQLYEVAQSIRKREMTLNEAFGAQAESFKTWARNDFDESVQRLAEGIRIAKRYQEAQERKKEKLGVPQTAEEVMELAKEVKAEKKKFQKVQSRYLLTDADQKVVNMLLRGDTTPEAVQNRENAEAILKTYEAKADYDLLALRLKAWNNTRKQGLRDQAENALNAAEAEKWVDKSSGLAYMRETMERNIRDIAKKGKVADEKAETFNNEYFHPVHKNESDRKSYVVGLQDRIKALNLSRKVENGNLVSESYAVQWLGEAEFNRKYLAEHPRVKQRGGFGYEEWNAAIQKFHEENPKLDYAKIEHAVKEFRSIYDQIYQDMNRVRMENGYEPVDYMQGYFPHFQENDKDGSLLTRFGRHLGITDEVTPLPATINGLTQSFRPGIRYMANIQQRLGYATAYDALQGFDRYIEVASDIIYHTGDIQRLRALATQIRYRASDEGVRKQIDRILQDPTLTPDEANERVAQAMKDAPFALSNFVAELDEYTNLLAGKKSRLDRGMEKMLGRKFYNICKAFESRVGANMVAANIGSAKASMRSAMMPSSRISGSGVMMPIISGAATYITKPMNAMTTMPSDTVMRAKRCVSIRRPAPLLCPTNVVAASAIP
nr:MAG TPA: PolyVal ADP-Ribosyltransferase [Caudoviricetes sp.]